MKSSECFDMAKALSAISVFIGAVILIFLLYVTPSSLICGKYAYMSAAFTELTEAELSPSAFSDDISTGKSAKIREYASRLNGRCARQAANSWADYVDFQRAEQEKIEAARKQFTLSK